MVSRRPAGLGEATSGRGAGTLARSPSERLEPTRPTGGSRRRRPEREPSRSRPFLRVLNGLLTFVLLMVVEAVSLPIFGVLYNMQWMRDPVTLAAVCMLATWGITIIGTVFSALTVNLRLRELMLPVLIYPMMIPALMAAMRLTTVLISEGTIPADDIIWLRLLVGFDIIFTALSVMLIDTVLIG